MSYANVPASKDWAWRHYNAVMKGEFRLDCQWNLACKALGKDPKERPHKEYRDRKQIAAGEE